MDNRTYELERQSSIEAEHSDAEHYDRWLVTLASGAFGVSIAFIQYIAPHPIPTSKKFLVAAWAALLLSIFATMLSLQLSQAGFRRYRELLDAQRCNQVVKNYRNIPAGVANVCNWMSLVLFFIGASMLATFSFLNLGS